MPARRVRILGLDPGSRHTGYGVIDQVGARLTTVEFGRFSPRPKAPVAERLAELAVELEKLVDECSPSHAALETPFQGLNPRTLIVLSQARGVLLAALARRGISVREYAPTEVKSAVSGYGRADKRQVQEMVRRILSMGRERLSSDAADALAVAICCAHRRRSDDLAERQ